MYIKQRTIPLKKGVGKFQAITLDRSLIIQGKKENKQKKNRPETACGHHGAQNNFRMPSNKILKDCNSIQVNKKIIKK